MKNLNAWLMPDESEVVSQFDRNFAQTVDQKEVLDNIGVQFYHVDNFCFYMVVAESI
jgi:hypothetical protein